MTSDANETDEYLDQIKRAVDFDAVVKTKIANLKSLFPDTPIFAFEGEDDKIVYARWVDRLRPSLDYEPFLCKGKMGVCRLKKILSRDTTDMAQAVFYFVDRDYDDLLHFPNSENTFMTDRYSIENYLVDEHVLERVLRDEFPCHSEPDVRSRIVALFTSDYLRFLAVTRNFNRALFLVRRLNQEFRSVLPQRIGHYAIVKLGDVGPPAEASERIFDFQLGQTPELQREFDTLDPRLRYRGKLSLLFFKAWLRKLEFALRAKDPDIFGQIDPSSPVRNSEFTPGGFASKSDFPEGLRDFLAGVTI